jgi:predicted transposase YbfD/YdcC
LARRGAGRIQCIAAAQTLPAEPGIADATVVTLDALHCQKNISRSLRKPT